MVAYAFEKRHHDAILRGDKPFTLRIAGRKRHARIGEEVQMLEGRAKPKFAIGECVFRARVLFAERGVVRVLNPSFTPLGDRLRRLFNAAEQGAPRAAEHQAKLARLDGFTTWADLVRWHAEQAPPDENGLIDREAIGWAHATAVAIRRAA